MKTKIKKKIAKKQKVIKARNKFPKNLLIGLGVLFVSIFVIVAATGQNQAILGNAQTAITPTFGAIGDCQTNGTCPTGGVSPSSVAITGKVPVITTPVAVTASPSNTTIQPCAATQSLVTTMANHRKKHGHGNGNNGNGFLQQILQFFMQLLQLLQQLFGGGTGPTPNPGSPSPVVNQPSQTPPSQGVPQPTQGGGQPSTAPNPSQAPCPPTSVPQPTTPAGGGGGQPTNVPTSVPAPTTPVTSSSCTNPKYTIPMDPNNAQAGVTIGNFYLTADTWNAANYQLTQTVYACDYNNWYAVANMNNNSGDGAVKTSPNVHEDINKPLNSLHTITSTFAESGPHVGIYEFEYDLWLNGFGNGSTEVMIWNDNFGQTPSGSKQGTFTDNGHTYDVWTTGNGYVAFVAQSNFTSGTVNILNFFNYVVSKGWASASSTVSQLDYGVELVSTNSTNQTFKVTNFSLTVN